MALIPDGADAVILEVPDELFTPKFRAEMDELRIRRNEWWRLRRERGGALPSSAEVDEALWEIKEPH